MTPIIQLALQTGWAAMLAGVLSGAVIGLCFHREDWMGGYSSYRRRLTRLGHISFFGIGFLNFIFAFSIPHVSLSPAVGHAGALALLLAAITMPTCCFLSAWRKPFRHLFFIPVLSAAAGIIIMLTATF